MHILLLNFIILYYIILILVLFIFFVLNYILFCGNIVKQVIFLYVFTLYKYILINN